MQTRDGHLAALEGRWLDPGPGGVTRSHLAAARAEARRRDRADPLAHVRQRFSLPRRGIYLDGNSLGALPRVVPSAVHDLVRRQWGRDLIGSWEQHDWWHAPERVGARVASVVGADATEVTVGDSTSVNLFKALVAACRLNPSRRRLMVESTNFPTDRYLAVSVAELLGLELTVVEPAGLGEAIDADTAVVTLSHVDYRTGRAWNVPRVTRAIQEAGALSVWDLSHSAGALDVRLGEWNVDFAVGCGYKYLNGGPGAPSFLMAARRHHERMRSPLPGWTGHSRPFGMEPDYAPAEGIARMRCGSPAMLSLLSLEAALSVFDDLALADVRRRSVELTSLLIDLGRTLLEPLGFRLLTPETPAERGSHVSYAHPHAERLVALLEGAGVVPDFRPGDVLRLGLSPLYLRRVDVVDAVAAIVRAHGVLEAELAGT